ncbi:permease [Bacillus alkalicellulosilyticus]|uniref:permease n=1 Tax=Alkalihalobacterium alkalicellulosilyticum TaxID=1912214 RepID=UPI0009961FD6|nr:permease [Bacillus alkalicellulosilyticus]
MVETIRSFIEIVVKLTFLFVGISFLLHILQSSIPYEKIEKKLKQSSPLIGGLIALFFAFITPFCSCSTIPIIVNLLKNQIRFGVVMVFLFASPVLDPTILSIMTVIMGWKVTILYLVITASLSLFIGLLLEKLGFEKSVKQVVVTGYNQTKKQFAWKNAWQETLNLLKSVYPYLVLGGAIGAVIHGLVPAEFISEHFGGEAWWLIPVAAIVGIPLYIRLSSMIPISQVLLMNGMAIGPVMAMMISSAGASLPELVLLKSIFRKSLIVTFVLSVITMSTISGFIFYLL